MSIDRAKGEAEVRYDGKFALRTDTRLAAAKVAVRYKRLLRTALQASPARCCEPPG